MAISARFAVDGGGFLSAGDHEVAIIAFWVGGKNSNARRKPTLHKLVAALSDGRGIVEWLCGSSEQTCTLN